VGCKSCSETKVRQILIRGMNSVRFIHHSSTLITSPVAESRDSRRLLQCCIPHRTMPLHHTRSNYSSPRSSRDQQLQTDPYCWLIRTRFKSCGVLCARRTLAWGCRARSPS
jgi:hypothetical protein